MILPDPTKPFAPIPSGAGSTGASHDPVTVVVLVVAALGVLLLIKWAYTAKGIQ